MNEYVMLLDLGISFMQLFLSKLGTKLPADVASAVQAAIDAVAAHKDDTVTKANLEAQR